MTLDANNLIAGAGSSFPGSPSVGMRWWRTDLGMEFAYDGTRWLSTQLHHALGFPLGVGMAATDARLVELPYPESLDKWIESLSCTLTVVAGGSALSGSHKWVLDLQKFGTGGAASAISTGAITIDSGASDGVYRTPITVAVNALLGTTYSGLRFLWTKTGTPGNLTAQSLVTYRLVAS